MATTQKGIYYPDDYTAVADVPEDMKDLAESVDTALGDLEDNIEQNIQPQIDDIVSEQTTQNNEIEALQIENARLKATLPTTTGSGENITLDKTAEMEFVQPPLPKGNSKQATAILPTGYTQLDYIESTGTQYINTGITPDTTLEFDTTFNTSNNLSMSNYGCIFGSRVGSGNKDIQLTTYSEFGYSGTIRWGNTYGGNAYLSNNTKINVKLKNNKYYVDNEEKQSITIDASNTYNIFIFALDAGGTVSQYGKLKLYTFKLWKNGSLVRNFVPCKNASDEVGLYDLASETFFANAGTGTFTAGDVATLPNPDFEVPIQNVTGDVEVVVSNADDTETQTFTFPLGTQRMYLGDYLADDGIHHVRGVVEYDGSNDESWATQNNCFVISITDVKQETTSTNILVLSNYYKGVKTNYRGSIASINNSIGKVIGANTQIAITDNRFSTVADFKTWLSANPITVEYVSTEEEIILYTEPQQQAYDEIKQALSYNEQTNISGTSDEANPIFSVEAYQSIKLILAS